MDLDTADPAAANSGPGYSVVAASLLVTALLLAGVISWFASRWPDGLEWSYHESRAARPSNPSRPGSRVVAAVDQWQRRWSPMTDYARRTVPLGQLPADEAAVAPPASQSASTWPNPDGWRSLAGVLGTILTLGVLCGVARWMRRAPIG